MTKPKTNIRVILLKMIEQALSEGNRTTVAIAVYKIMSHYGLSYAEIARIYADKVVAEGEKDVH